MNKLPVWATVKAAVIFVFTNLWSMIQVCIPWIVIVGIVFFGAIATFGSAVMLDPAMAQTAGFSAGLIVAWALVGLIYFVAEMAIFIAWHRIVLLGETAQLTSALRFDRIFWRYLGYYVLLTVVSLFIMGVFAGGVYLSAPSKVLAAVFGILTFVAFVAVIVVFIRCSFVLPAVAIEEPAFGLGASWRATAGNGWRLVGVLLIAGLIALAISLARDAILYVGGTGGLVGLVLDLVFEVVVLVITSAIGMTTLSLAFGQLVKGRALR